MSLCFARISAPFQPAIEGFHTRSAALLSMLFQRRIDVAFCLEGAATAECDTQSLWTESLHAAFPETHPLSGCDIVAWELLKGEHFIFGRDATDLGLDRLAADRIAGAGGRISFEAHDASQDAVMRLVALHFGLGLASDARAGIGNPGVVFRPIQGENSRLSFYAVWLPGNDNPALRRFLNLARTMSAERRASSA
jgi:DNA-binding transcriptional LysR family regulator